MTTANTAYAGPSVSLTAGTWLVTSEININTVVNPQNYATATVVLGTSATAAYTTGSSIFRNSGNGANGNMTISLSTIVTLASTTSVGLWAYSDLAGTVIEVTPLVNPQTAKTATAIHAVRIQ
jgi:hypothetical protein